MKQICWIVSLLFSSICFGQQKDSAENHLDLGVTASITNNGFSFIPAFSLGDPAIIATLSVSDRKRFSFEPEFRFSMKGKPWSFIFIWRYKLIKRENFTITLGTHLPAINFVSDSSVQNGYDEDVIRARRFFPVLEFNPAWHLSKNISVGLFYQYGHGIEKEVPENGHFVSLRAYFNYIPLSNRVFLKFNPQVFYLNLDGTDGWYVATTLGLYLNKFPLSITSQTNTAISTQIPGNEFEWNVSLVYSFFRSFRR